MKNFLTGLLIVGILIIGAALIQATNLGQKLADLNIKPTSQLAVRAAEWGSKYDSQKSNTYSVQQVNDEIEKIFQRFGVQNEKTERVKEVLASGINGRVFEEMLIGMEIGEEVIIAIFQELERLGVVVSEEEPAAITYTTFQMPVITDLRPGNSIDKLEFKAKQTIRAQRLNTLLTWFGNLPNVLSLQKLVGVEAGQWDNIYGIRTNAKTRTFVASLDSAMTELQKQVPDAQDVYLVGSTSTNYFAKYDPQAIEGKGGWVQTSLENVATLLAALLVDKEVQVQPALPEGFVDSYQAVLVDMSDLEKWTGFVATVKQLVEGDNPCSPDNMACKDTYDELTEKYNNYFEIKEGYREYVENTTIWRFDRQIQKEPLWHLPERFLNFIAGSFV